MLFGVCWYIETIELMTSQINLCLPSEIKCSKFISDILIRSLIPFFSIRSYLNNQIKKCGLGPLAKPSYCDLIGLLVKISYVKTSLLTDIAQNSLCNRTIRYDHGLLSRSGIFVPRGILYEINSLLSGREIKNHVKDRGIRK